MTPLKKDDRVTVTAANAPTCRTGTVIEVYPEGKGYLVHHDEPGFTEGLFAGRQDFSWTTGEVIALVDPLDRLAQGVPTLYLSNWSSHATPGHHGPGRKLTIMGNPRSWECGEGRVTALVPGFADLRSVREGSLSMDAYRYRYEAGMERHMASGALQPLYTTAGGGTSVRDGDTLCCACSRDNAAKGECHRAWAAAALLQAGWNVVLDGEVLSNV